MGVRSFRDVQGNSWDVWQLARRKGEAPRRSGWDHSWLWFESGPQARRLPDPPSGWSEWPDEALERLCRAAEPGVPPGAVLH